MATKQDLMDKYGEDVVTDLVKRGNDGDIEATKQLANWEFYIAQFIVGNHYQRVGDIDRAIYWWKEAANQNYADAMYNLATTYENGYGIEPNPQKAIEWYEKADKLGYPIAKLRMGIFHCYGKHVPHDIEEGKFMIEEAETLLYDDEIDPSTLNELGDLFCSQKINIDGVPSKTDIEKSMDYYYRAAESYKKHNLQDLFENALKLYNIQKEKLSPTQSKDFDIVGTWEWRQELPTFNMEGPSKRIYFMRYEFFSDGTLKYTSSKGANVDGTYMIRGNKVILGLNGEFVIEDDNSMILYLTTPDGKMDETRYMRI